MGIDRIDGVVIRIMKGQEAEGWDFGVELGEFMRPGVWARDVDVIGGGFDDVAEFGDVEQAIAGAGKDAGGFEGGVDTGVEDETVFFFELELAAFGFAVMGQAGAGARGDVEETEERLGSSS